MRRKISVWEHLGILAAMASMGGIVGILGAFCLNEPVAGPSLASVPASVVYRDPSSPATAETVRPHQE